MFYHSKLQLKRNAEINKILEYLHSLELNHSVRKVNFSHIYTFYNKDKSRLVELNVFKEKTLLSPPLAVRYMLHYNYERANWFHTFCDSFGFEYSFEKFKKHINNLISKCESRLEGDELLQEVYQDQIKLTENNGKRMNNEFKKLDSKFKELIVLTRNAHKAEVIFN